MSRKEDVHLFNRLLRQVAEGYERSDVKVRQEELRRPGSAAGHWYFDLLGLPIVRRADVLLGLNWMVNVKGHKPPSTYPGNAQYESIRSWPFPGRHLPEIEHYFAGIRRLNYFNVCPFRAPSIADLTDLDWQIGIECFFRELLDHIRPPRILLMGTGAVEHLERLDLGQFEWVSIGSDMCAIGFIRGASTNYRCVAMSRRRSLGSDVKREMWQTLLPRLEDKPGRG
jgi:hypothetical protein